MKGLGHMFDQPAVCAGGLSHGIAPAERSSLARCARSPACGANRCGLLVDVAITRLLVMIIPLGYLALLGMEQLVAWLAQNIRSWQPAGLGWALALLGSAERQHDRRCPEKRTYLV